MGRTALPQFIILGLVALSPVGIAAGAATRAREPQEPTQVPARAEERRGEEPYERQHEEPAVDDTRRLKEPSVDYMLHLTEDDFATYTHPIFGFTFRYPKDFMLSTTVGVEEDMVDAFHPTLPLEIRVSVWPRRGTYEDADFTVLPDEYVSETWVSPEGAETEATAWIEDGVPTPGQYRGTMRFVGPNGLYQIEMSAPDAERLEAWMKRVLQDDFTLPVPSGT